jgi:hypothetical protein
MNKFDKYHDDWKLDSPKEPEPVWNTDKFDYSSDNLDNIIAFDEGLLLATSLGMDEESLEEYAEELAKELGLR